MRLSIFILSLALLCPPLLNAAPSVSSVSGTTTLTITGSDFGSNALDLEWTGDNIDAGTSGSNFSKTGWSVSSDSSSNVAPDYSTASYHTAPNSLLSEFYGDQYDSYYAFDCGEETQFYITMWVRIAKNDISDQFQWKHTYISSRDVISVYSGFRGAIWWIDDNGGWGNNWNVRRLAATDVITSPDLSAYDTMGDWMRVEVYVQKSSAVDTADGVFAWDRVDQPSYSKSSSAVITHTTGDEAWRYVRPSWYYGNLEDGVTRDADIYIDDIYISDTRARVEIGDASTWAACTHREIQIPTAWSDTSITATVNQGSFADSTTVYVYVIDDDGDASGGYEITVGSDVTAPTFTSAAINSSSAQITLSEDVTINGLDDGDFVMTGSTTGARNLNSCSEASGMITCTATGIFVNGETVTLAYSGSADEVEDLSGNDLETFSGESVTNNTPAGSASCGFSAGDGSVGFSDGGGSVAFQ